MSAGKWADLHEGGNILCTEYEGWRLEARRADGKLSAPPGWIDIVLINPEGLKVGTNGSIIMHYQNFTEGTELNEAIVAAREAEKALKELQQQHKALRKEHSELKQQYAAELAGWEGKPLLHKAHLERGSS